MTLPLDFFVPSILERVAHANRILVLLDFDGTLAPFEADPSSAQMPEETRRRLSMLAEHPRATVGVVSGRALGDLMPRVGIKGVVYAGNHGIEIVAQGRCFVEPCARALEPALTQIVSELRAQLLGLPNVRVEDKQFTATVHWRTANEAERTRASELVLTAVHASPHFHCRPGRHEVDILPRCGWHKGTAAHWIRRELGLDDALVLYAGDDVSDEDAFAALPAGVTIKIGRSQTQAAYFSEGPPALWSLLEQLVTALSGPVPATLLS